MSRKELAAAFAPFQVQYPLKSERNRVMLSDELKSVMRRARAAGVTPVQIEEDTGISVYRIHKIAPNPGRKGRNYKKAAASANPVV